MSREQPLSVAIEGDELIVRIGIDTLAQAAITGPHFDEIVGDADGEEVKITDADMFAKAICAELNRDEEDGTTLVNLMLDKAAISAVESGCEGVELPEPAKH